MDFAKLTTTVLYFCDIDDDDKLFWILCKLHIILLKLKTNKPPVKYYVIRVLKFVNQIESVKSLY